jgi:sulfoxide reductase heme-binding subunit YedZ
MVMKEFQNGAWLRPLVHVGAWVPLAYLLYGWFTGGLGVNPIQYLVQNTGLTGIRLLMLSIACTPLVTLFQFRPAQTVRRALGLYGFMYIVLHFAAFAILDFGLDLELILIEIAEKPYIVIGVLALLSMIPLAITSTRGWQKRLGAAWKRLHRVFYVTMVLGVVHYWWSQKADLNEALLIYAPILLLLFIARIPAVRRAIAARRTAGAALSPLAARAQKQPDKRA